MRAAATPGMFEAFGAYAQRMTARLRAGVHAQTYAHVAQRLDRTKLSPTGRLAMQRVAELSELRRQHRCSCDPALRARALQLLRTLPLLSADEDAHFVTTLRTLRLAAYFDAAHEPTTFRVLNHLTRHSYLLDGYNLYTLAHILRELRHPQTAEVLEIVLPRLYDMGDDVTAHEAALLLTMLHTYKVHDTRAQRALVDVIVHSMADLPVLHTARCVAALACVDVDIARDAIARVADALTTLLRDACAQYVALHLVLSSPPPQQPPHAAARDNDDDHDDDNEDARVAAAVEEMYEVRQLVRELCVCLSRLHTSPRRLMNAITTVALTWHTQPDTMTTHAWQQQSQSPQQQPQKTLPLLTRLDLCDVVCLMHSVHYRNDRALLQLVTRFASLRDTRTSRSHVDDADGNNDAVAAAGVARCQDAVSATAATLTPHRAGVLLAALAAVLRAVAHASSPSSLPGIAANAATTTTTTTSTTLGDSVDDVCGSDAATASVVTSVLDEAVALLPAIAQAQCTDRVTMSSSNGGSSRQGTILHVDEMAMLSLVQLLQSMVELHVMMQQQQQQPHAPSLFSAAHLRAVQSICTCELLQRYAAAAVSGDSDSGAVVSTTTQLLALLVQLAQQWCEARLQQPQQPQQQASPGSEVHRLDSDDDDALPLPWMHVIAQLMTGAVRTVTTRAHARHDDAARVQVALRVLQNTSSSSSSTAAAAAAARALHAQAARHMPLDELQQQMQTYAST